MDLLTPSSPGGLPTLSLTTSSSWLPWGKVAMPLVSPLMPVLLVSRCIFLQCSGLQNLAPAVPKGFLLATSVGNQPNLW